MATRLNEIQDYMESQGFRIVRKKKHIVWKDKDGNIVTTAISPTNKQQLRHIKRIIKRLRDEKATPA